VKSWKDLFPFTITGVRPFHYGILELLKSSIRKIHIFHTSQEFGGACLYLWENGCKKNIFVKTTRLSIFFLTRAIVLLAIKRFLKRWSGWGNLYHEIMAPSIYLWSFQLYARRP
jgi:hypothetical protein